MVYGAQVKLPSFTRMGEILLGLFFLFAGSSKLYGFHAFAEHISDFGLLPEPMIPTTAAVFCGLEITGGMGLILGKNWALGILSGLLIIFQFVLSYGIWLGLDIDCGCLGIERYLPFQVDLKVALYRNFIFLALCASIYYQKRKTKDDPTNPSHSTSHDSDHRVRPEQI